MGSGGGPMTMSRSAAGAARACALLLDERLMTVVTAGRSRVRSWKALVATLAASGGLGRGPLLRARGGRCEGREGREEPEE